MIEGSVSAALEPIISLTLRGPSGRTARLDAVVDTGFNNFLILPTALVRELELPWTGRNLVTLADGSVAAFDIYDVTVMWDGQPRTVDAFAAEATPLAGMALLERHRLLVEVEEEGRVVIEARA